MKILFYFSGHFLGLSISFTSLNFFVRLLAIFRRFLFSLHLFFIVKFFLRFRLYFQ